MSAVLENTSTSILMDQTSVPDKPTRSKRLAAKGIRLPSGKSRRRTMALAVMLTLPGLAILLLLWEELGQLLLVYRTSR